LTWAKRQSCRFRCNPVLFVWDVVHESYAVQSWVKSGDIESTLPKNERVGPISICNGEEQQKKEGSIPKHDNDDDDDARVLFQI
jgi:hypothetical protein